MLQNTNYITSKGKENFVNKVYLLKGMNFVENCIEIQSKQLTRY